MSLGKLLTSGKCLVGLQDAEGRYEMRTKNLLPKFGSDKNPFSRTKPQSLQSSVVEKIPTIARTMTTAEITAAQLKETKRLPVVTAIKTTEPMISKVALPARALGWLKEWTKQARLLSGKFRRRSKTTPPAALPSGKAPVQVELSLDKIKVVRNDLSDGDLEVVPVKISVKSKTEAIVQSAEPVEETAELIKT
jgi:hypothetical protein